MCRVFVKLTHPILRCVKNVLSISASPFECAPCSLQPGEHQRRQRAAEFRNSDCIFKVFAGSEGINSNAVSAVDLVSSWSIASFRGVAAI